MLVFSTLVLVPACLLSQSAAGPSDPDPGAVAGGGQQQVEPAKPTTSGSATEKKRNYYLEMSGYYSRFTPGTTSWRGADARLIYSGFKKFTPFGGLGILNTSSGSQQTFGAGSYLNFSKRFYSICGFGFAPNSATVFYPRARFDVAGMFTVPKAKGLILSTGFTELLPYRSGGGGRIFSVGGILYYRKAIISGSVNFNEALPKAIRSTSGQFGIMYGAQGKYWISGGMGGGRVAYQLITNVPFDVRYDTISNFVLFQKWLSRHYGVIIRYDYQRAFANFGRHGIKPSLFFEL